MIKFSHIYSLHNVVNVAKARRDDGAPLDRVPYIGRVKLHGSNASVVCVPKGLQPQSRNRSISIDDDNLGFAAFCAREAQIAAVRTIEAELRAQIKLHAERPLVLFGEWLGPGVQKGVALTELPQRQWVLFAVATRDEDAERKRYFELPKLGERFAAASIYSVADVREWSLELDFSHRASLELAAGAIEDATREVEACCPWGARFGVEGVGEGIVWQPLGDFFGDSELVFKSKGDKHQVARRAKSDRQVSIDPVLLASVEAFLAYAVTEPRLEQGLDVLREQGLGVEMRSLGAFLKWLAGDIRRECADELAHSDLEWKQVARGVNERAKTWFRKQLMVL